jgi:predicted TPR repeat methyltransferase
MSHVGKLPAQSSEPSLRDHRGGPARAGPPRRRSARAESESVRGGRLVLVHGDASALADLAPVDIVFAVYVLPFRHRPDEELARVHAALRAGGALALGHEPAEDLGPFWRTRFAREGHVFDDSDDDLSRLLHGAGFRSVDCRGLHDRDRLALAIA